MADDQEILMCAIGGLTSQRVGGKCNARQYDD